MAKLWTFFENLGLFGASFRARLLPISVALAPFAVTSCGYLDENLKDLRSSSPTDDSTIASLVLSDLTSGSAVVTNDVAITVAIAGDSGAAKWCLSETQTTAPASGSVACNGGQGSTY